MRAHLCLALLGGVTGAVLDHTSLDTSSAALNGATGEAYACKSGDCSNGLYWSDWDFENTELTMTVGEKIVFLFASDANHNVHVVASEDDFNSDPCSQAPGTTVANSGIGGGTNNAGQCMSSTGCRDKYEAVVTQPGTLYFFCTPHCYQQKIKVTVVSYAITFLDNGPNYPKGTITLSQYGP